MSQDAVGVTLTAFHAVTTFVQVAELRPYRSRAPLIMPLAACV